jgi:anthranilate phosphoribosyltransferase
VRDVVALNAAAALLVAGAVPDLGAGLEQAIAAIGSGKAASVLETFVLTSKAARAADEA